MDNTFLNLWWQLAPFWFLLLGLLLPLPIVNGDQRLTPIMKDGDKIRWWRHRPVTINVGGDIRKDSTYLLWVILAAWQSPHIAVSLDSVYLESRRVREQVKHTLIRCRSPLVNLGGFRHLLHKPDLIASLLVLTLVFRSQSSEAQMNSRCLDADLFLPAGAGSLGPKGSFFILVTILVGVTIIMWIWRWQYNSGFNYYND